MGKGDDLVVLGDILPVINEDGLQTIWDLELDRWSSVKSVLLNVMLANKSVPKKLVVKTVISKSACHDD